MYKFSMTGHNYDDSYFFPPDDEEEEQKEAQELLLEAERTGPLAEFQALRRTKADEIIDAVAPVEKVDPNVCKVCDAVGQFRVRGGMGGMRTRICLSCRTESPLATVRDPVVASNRSGQLPSGPYYGPPKAKPSRTDPPHRVSATLAREKK